MPPMSTTIYTALLLLACAEGQDSASDPAPLASVTVAAGEVAEGPYIGEQLYMVELCYAGGYCVQDSRGVRQLGRVCWPSHSEEGCLLEAPPDADLVVRLGR